MRAGLVCTVFVQKSHPRPPVCVQRWRLAEIRLEDHAFVTLSRIIQQLEAAVSARLGLVVACVF